MNDLAIEFFDLIKNGDDIDFIMDHQYLHDRIEFLIAKPIKLGVDVVADDLPKELTDLRLELSKIEAFRNNLELLNEIIWRQVNHRKE